MDFACEMEKLLVTDFSVFEVYLNAKGHVFTTFMLHLLRMHRIRTNTQKLKIVLPGWYQVIIHVAYISYYTHNTCSNHIVLFFNVLDATSTKMYRKLSLSRSQGLEEPKSLLGSS
jgi:hypothetical protein